MTIEVAGSLADRFTCNEAALQSAARRLSVALAGARRRCAEQRRLVGEVRERFVDLRRGIAVARKLLRSPEPNALVLVPSRKRPVPDRVDALRQRLHEDYAATGDPAVRSQLMESYDGFARSLALQFRHRESVDDLVQVARIGLLHAIDRFDPTLGRPFPLFARITITGELKRHIRDKTWAMRVPRSIQEDYLNVMRAVDDLTNEHFVSPSMDVLAAHCGLSVERVVEAMELRSNQRILSLDAPAGPGSDDPVLEVSQDDNGFGQLENRHLVISLLDRLPARDRRIIELRFMHEMTQSEIADQIGVSQMCVSRVLARTLGRLRLWARTALN